MKKSVVIKQELLGLNIEKSQDYFNAISSALKRKTDIRVDIIVFETNNKEVIKILHRNKLIGVTKKGRRFLRKHNSLRRLLFSALDDYNYISNLLLRKGA